MRELHGITLTGWRIYTDFGGGLQLHGHVKSAFVDAHLRLVYTNIHDTPVEVVLHAMVWNPLPDQGNQKNEVWLFKRRESYQDVGLNPPRILMAQTIVFAPPKAD